MQRIKLPSGTIVDIDAISRITVPTLYNGVSKACSYIIDGYTAETINADADALYQAVDALVCNPAPVDSDGAEELRAIVDDILRRVDTAMKCIDGNVPVTARQCLRGILLDYADPDAFAGSPAAASMREAKS